MSPIEWLYKVCDFVKEQGCPCAFPRVRYLLTFDPMASGIGPYDIEFAQGLIYQFTSPKSAHRMLLGEPDHDRVCTKCGSRYHVRWEQFSIQLDYGICELKELKAKELGAPVVLPMPIAGRMMTHQNGAHMETMVRLFKNVGESPEDFYRYMTELA